MRIFQLRSACGDTVALRTYGERQLAGVVAAVEKEAEGRWLLRFQRRTDSELRQVRYLLRAANEQDKAEARGREQAMGGGGLGGLAERCPQVVGFPEAGLSEPELAWLGALFAGTGLGPAMPDDAALGIWGAASARKRAGV